MKPVKKPANHGAQYGNFALIHAPAPKSAISLKKVNGFYILISVP
jgi:hypothetical protein